MNKYLDKLLEKSIENGWYDGYTIDTDASEIQKVLLEFGKQCFDAALNGKLVSQKWFDDIGNFKNGFALVELNDKWNFIIQI